jgi:hypothetical protein
MARKGRMGNEHFATCCCCIVVAALAVGFTYFVAKPPPRAVEAEEPSAPAAPDVTCSVAGTPTIIGQHRTAEDFERAAKEILKRLPDAEASARSDELPIVGHIPMPKRRPIPR